MTTRRRFTAAFKARVALDALRGETYRFEAPEGAMTFDLADLLEQEAAREPPRRPAPHLP